MRYRILFILLLMGTIALPTGAQNAIDKMIDNYSVVGGSTFTTAVERNPSTRKVEKIVKRLHVNGVRANEFVRRFKSEAKQYRNVVETRKDGETTMTLIDKGKSGSRIYMLKYASSRFVTDATITLIIVPK